MSMSAESLNIRRKRTATERATNNADPLVVRKKAREATGAPVPKKSKNASVSRKVFLSSVNACIDVCRYPEPSWIHGG